MARRGRVEDGLDTIDDLERELERADVTLVVHAVGESGWTIWVYDPDEPDSLIQRTHKSLERALGEALSELER